MDATLRRKDIEKIVLERTKELEEARAHSFHSAKLASLGEMAGNIAHEINNPLAIIMSTAELMKRKLDKGHLSELDEEAFKDKLDKIEKVVNRTSKIIQGLRNLSRADQNEEFQNLCLGQLIDSTLELCTEKFKLSSVQLKLDIERPCLINGREVQLSQVLLNLLNNAFDAIKDMDNKWIEIFAKSDGERVVLAIIDSGPTPSIEVREKMFQPFFTTKGVNQGTGLGLSITRKIIDEHSGKVWIDESSVHTRFVLEFPKIKKK
jgi:C4-dicarboxylate-specific signal transduction histidine kinase